MAGILVSLKDDAVLQDALDQIEQSGHGALVIDPADYGSETLAAIEEAVKSSRPALILMDYVPEDAFSVKLMQKVRDSSRFIKFIFFLNNETEIKHLIMAMNEGASAFLDSPLSKSLLKNYIKRALTRRNMEIEHEEELERCRKVKDEGKTDSIEQTDEIFRLKRNLELGSRLISHLLSSSSITPKPEVLLVSDSSYQMEMFKSSLEDHNFSVNTEKDGESALERIKKEKPGIIVSDLEMPGLNGIELCRAVKNDESLIPNYFIICTANQEKIDEVMKPENKVDDCLLKPGRPDDFNEFVARVALGLII